MQQIIDESRIVLDQVPAPPAMTLDVVRPSRDQIQEELRRCHKQLTPDESGEGSLVEASRWLAFSSDTSRDFRSASVCTSFLSTSSYFLSASSVWVLTAFSSS